MKKLLFLLIIISTICSGQIINKSSPQAQGLILNYPLVERGGNIAVPGFGVYNGALTNGPYFNNGFLYLDGSNDLLIGNANIPNLTNSNVLTISFWFSFISHSSYGAILTKSSSSSNNSLLFDFGVTFNSTTNRLSLNRNGGGVNCATILTANVITHIVCEIGENRSVLYVNGVKKEVLAGVASGNNISTTNRPFNICTTGTPTNMYIKDVRIYNRALTPTEVMDLYINPNKIVR
jgi:hypothetical protein